MAAIYDQMLIFSSSGSYIFYVEATEHIESDFEFREKIIKFVLKIIIFPSFIKHFFQNLYTYHSMFRQITPAVTARINFPDYLLDYKDSHYMEFSRNAVCL